jgi:hypothetical protein
MCTEPQLGVLERGTRGVRERNSRPKTSEPRCKAPQGQPPTRSEGFVAPVGFGGSGGGSRQAPACPRREPAQGGGGSRVKGERSSSAKPTPKAPLRRESPPVKSRRYHRTYRHDQTQPQQPKNSNNQQDQTPQHQSRQPEADDLKQATRGQQLQAQETKARPRHNRATNAKPDKANPNKPRNKPRNKPAQRAHTASRTASHTTTPHNEPAQRARTTTRTSRPRNEHAQRARTRTPTTPNRQAASGHRGTSTRTQSRSVGAETS